MQPVEKINLPEWMRLAELEDVMAVLSDGDETLSTLLVGGCVRNALMEKGVTDIDIATIFTPDTVSEKLKKAGIKVIPTGIDHGTVTAVHKGKSFEITTLRRDVETDGRRAVIAFTKDWKEDAERRDFTINTLLCDFSGQIYDPTGQGLHDLRAGRVVFVGDAQTRISEDYLRILRFFRFYAYYGKSAPDVAALTACESAAENIAELSRERITQEFLKILAVDTVTDILNLMFDNNVMTDVKHKGFQPGTLTALASLQKSHGVVDVMARLVVLAGFDDNHMKVFKRYFVFSNKQKKALETFLRMPAAGVKELVYRLGNDMAAQVLLLRAAKEDSAPAGIETAKDWQAPSLPVTGHDIKALGVKDGPETGRILSEVERWWIGNDFTPDRDACLARLEFVYDAGR